MSVIIWTHCSALPLQCLERHLTQEWNVGALPATPIIIVSSFGEHSESAIEQGDQMAPEEGSAEFSVFMKCH